MGLKDDWKNVGKSIGNTAKDLGKGIVKSVKVGIDKADDWAEDKPKDPNEPKEPTGLKETWGKVGNEIGETAAAFGKTVVNTAKEGIDRADDWANRDETPKPEDVVAEYKDPEAK